MLGIRRTLIQVAVGALLLSGSAFASLVCADANHQVGGLAYAGTGPDYMAYCLDSYGSANGWYNQQDMPGVNLLGGSAMWIQYSYDNGGGDTGTVSSWLAAAVPGGGTHGSTNFTDSGTLSGHVASAIHTCTSWGNNPGDCTTPSALQVDPQAESTIINSTDGLVITIDSAVIGARLKQVVTITNVGSNLITGWQMGSFFQYFPYGSGNDNTGAYLSYKDVRTIEGSYVFGLSANYDPVTNANPALGGQQCGGFVSGGGVGSCATPDSYELNSDAATVANIIGDGTGYVDHSTVNYTALNNPAGGLLFSTTSSSNNQTFVLELVPEPGTMLLFGAGLLGVAALLRRRRKGA